MRQILLTVLLTLPAVFSSGQEKKDLALSFFAGVLNSPYYDNAHSRGVYGISFDYHITPRHVLSASYFDGGHRYFDNTLSNTPASVYVIMPGGTNAEAKYNTFSVAYKYKIINLAKLSVAPGAGAGIMTHSRRYPYTQGSTLSFQTSSWSDLVFPITLEMDYKTGRHWQMGLIGGFLIHPDYPILALHAGPKLSYILK